MPSGPEGIESLAESLVGSDRVALEVTGSCWEVVRILEPHVNRVVVVSPDDTGIASDSIPSGPLGTRPPSESRRPRRPRPHKHIQADRPADPPRQRHPSPPQLAIGAGEPAGQRHRPIRAQPLNPGKSQGRPNEKHGLETHRSKRPTRPRSPNKALSRIGRTYGQSRTERPTRSFMPREPALS